MREREREFLPFIIKFSGHQAEFDAFSLKYLSGCLRYDEKINLIEIVLRSNEFIN